MHIDWWAHGDKDREEIAARQGPRPDFEGTVRNGLVPEDTMKLIPNALLAAIIVAVGTLTSSIEAVAAKDKVPPQVKNLGGVNLNAYCKRYHGSRSRAVIVENHAGGWRCQDNAGNDFGISVQRACEDTYRQRPIKAITVGNGPGDWRCRHTVRPT